MMIKDYIFLLLFSVGAIWCLKDLLNMKNIKSESDKEKKLYKENKILLLGIYIFLVDMYVEKIFF